MRLGSGPDDDAESFWGLGGWEAANTGGQAAAAKKTSARGKAPSAKYRHERSSGGGLEPMGPVDSPWKGQGPNAPFDQVGTPTA